jgi:hypothetical protein
MTDLHPWESLNNGQTVSISSKQEPTVSAIHFYLPAGGEEVLRLDNEGFHYRGQLIEDAGEAHRLMVAFLRQGTAPALAEQPVGPTDEELLELQENLWNTYKDAGYRDEEVMYEHSFGFALDDFARAVLARWGTSNLTEVRSSLGEVVEDDVDLYLEQ